MNRSPRKSEASGARAGYVETEWLASDPIVAVLAALERGADVFMVYAGARGISQHVITPLEVDEARVRAYCHLRGDERSFWLSSIQVATDVGRGSSGGRR